jgi:phosphoglycerate kinase
MKKLSDLKNEELVGKNIFLRADLDVPIKNGVIEDDIRLKAWFPTLELLIKNNCTVYIAGHLGRPEGVDEKFSIRVIAHFLKKELNINQDTEVVEKDGFKLYKLTDKLFLFENLRFYKEEEGGDSDFSRKLSSFVDIYINDAFSASHRAHASIVGIPKLIPSFAGLRLEKEVEVLSEVLERPKRPLCIIIGGAKIETKLPLVEKMHHFADYVLVGGEIAENDKVLLKVSHEKVTNRKSALIVADLTENSKDITLKSAENFVQIIKISNTVIWNGPMGLFEEKENEKGTEILANGIIEASVDTIVGGGDTLSFLKSKDLLSKFTFISMGGGAMLEFLSGQNLPGIDALS